MSTGNRSLMTFMAVGFKQLLTSGTHSVDDFFQKSQHFKYNTHFQFTCSPTFPCTNLMVTFSSLLTGKTMKLLAKTKN